MAEPDHAVGHPHQSRVLRRSEVVGQPVRADRPRQHRDLPVTGGGEQQDGAGALGEERDLLPEGALHARRRGLDRATEDGGPAELEEGERVAGGARDDDRRGQGVEVDAGSAQQHGGVAVVERGQRHVGVAHQCRRRRVTAGGRQERGPGAGEPARHEPQHRQGALVAPLRVVQDHHDGPLLAQPLQPGQHLQAQAERVDGERPRGGREDRLEDRLGSRRQHQQVDEHSEGERAPPFWPTARA
ncbi:hypothetical protein GCM10023146_07040 [Nocardioides caricicola]